MGLSEFQELTNRGLQSNSMGFMPHFRQMAGNG